MLGIILTWQGLLSSVCAIPFKDMFGFLGAKNVEKN